MELVILAAGMGSRFGGLKQIEPIDEYNNFIIDYSIYDAIEAGFDCVTFIIKKEIFEEFKETIGKRIESKIKVKYAFQELDDLPEGFTLPINRSKPWGTAHAILAAKDVIEDNFIIINADEYYGKDAFKVAANYLKNLRKDEQGAYANVVYHKLQVGGHVVFHFNVVPLAFLGKSTDPHRHAAQPLQKIQLVGALIQQHAAALASPGGAPGPGIVVQLAAIPVGDGPGHALHGAQLAAVQDLLHFAVNAVGALVEHQREGLAAFPGSFQHRLHLLGVHSHGLFAQHMQAVAQRMDG